MGTISTTNYLHAMILKLINEGTDRPNKNNSELGWKRQQVCITCIIEPQTLRNNRETRILVQQGKEISSLKGP